MIYYCADRQQQYRRSCNPQSEISMQQYLEEKLHGRLESELIQNIDDGDYNKYLEEYWEYLSEWGNYDE